MNVSVMSRGTHSNDGSDGQLMGEGQGGGGGGVLLEKGPRPRDLHPLSRDGGSIQVRGQHSGQGSPFRSGVRMTLHSLNFLAATIVFCVDRDRLCSNRYWTSVSNRTFMAIMKLLTLSRQNKIQDDTEP